MADILYYSPNCWPVAEDTKDTKQTITMTSPRPRMCCVLGGRDLVESLVIIRSPSLSSSKVSRIFVVTIILPLFLWARIWFYRFLLRSGPGSLYAIFWLLPCNHLHPNFACKVNKSSTLNAIHVKRHANTFQLFKFLVQTGEWEDRIIIR